MIFYHAFFYLPFMPEAQTLLTVVEIVVSLRPAPRAAWRAGFWPRPADKTQPKMTSSTASAGKLAFLRAATSKISIQQVTAV